MSWTHVQHNNKQDSTGTTSLTWSVTLGAGVSANSAVSGEFMWDATASATLLTVKSDQGDTATIVDTKSDPGNEDSASYLFAGLTAGATIITATLSMAAGFIALSVDEDNPGAGLVAVLDGHNTNFQSSVATGINNVTTNAATPSANGALIKSFAMNSSSECDFSAGTSPNAFTARNNLLGAAGHISIISEDFVQTTAASITPTIGISNIGANCNVLSFMIALKAAGGAASHGLFLNSTLALGAGGPFFADRLA